MSGIEKLAFLLFLGGPVIFFVWVVVLAIRNSRLARSRRGRSSTPDLH